MFTWCAVIIHIFFKSVHVASSTSKPSFLNVICRGFVAICLYIFAKYKGNRE